MPDPHTHVRGPRPVLLIGMHRSGTSMLTRMLSELGLFIGQRLDENSESTFFQGLNDWILRASGGSWERPQAIRELLAEQELRDLTREYLAHMLDSPRALSYLGPRRYLRHRSAHRLSDPWGFKDPRTTFTLPLWLELFPEARVVHVRRHGVAVAQSLLVRQRRSLTAARAQHERRRHAYWLRPKRGGFAHTVRALTLDGGFALWDEYMQEAERQLALLGEQALDLRYEDLLADPRAELTRAAQHCRLQAPPDALERIAAGVRTSRARAWSEDPKLVRFAARGEASLAAHGYPAATSGRDRVA